MHKMSWLVALSVVTGPALAEEKTIDPGFYEVVTKTTMQGVSAGDPTTARMCLTASDVAKGLAPALDKGCTWKRNVTGGGKLEFATTCPDSTMVATGSYTSTGYVIDGKITMKDGGETMMMETHITAKRLRDKC